MPEYYSFPELARRIRENPREFFKGDTPRTLDLLDNASELQKIEKFLKSNGHEKFHMMAYGADAIVLQSASGQVIRLNGRAEWNGKFIVPDRPVSEFHTSAIATQNGQTYVVEILPNTPSFAQLIAEGKMTKEQALAHAENLRQRLALQGYVASDALLTDKVIMGNIGLNARGVPELIDPGSNLLKAEDIKKKASVAPGFQEIYDEYARARKAAEANPQLVEEARQAAKTKTPNTTVGDARINTTTRGAGLGLGVFGTASDGVGLVQSLIKGDWSGAGQSVVGLVSSAGMVVNDALSMLGKAASLTLNKVAAITAVTSATKAIIAYVAGDNEGTKTHLASGTGALAGSVGGATIGASIGAWVGGFLGTAIPIPVVGTVSGIALGTAIGGFIGGIVGGWGGSTLAENAVKVDPHKQAALPTGPEKTVAIKQVPETRPANYTAYAPSEELKAASDAVRTVTTEPEKKIVPVVLAATTQTKTPAIPKTAAPAVA